MTTVAEVVDAVIGVDTHRDTHTLELTSPIGARLAVVEIENTSLGYAQAWAWIGEHAPGPRLMVGSEGTRSYGIGFSRALQAAGMVVVEIERPDRKQRRGQGKSDPIDAHHASIKLLSMDVAALPQPRCDGTREGLRILLVSRLSQVATQTAQTNQLHALLLTGDDTDRALGKGAFTRARLNELSTRPRPEQASLEQQIRHGEAARLAQALLTSKASLKANNEQLKALVKELNPTLLDKPGVGPVSGAQTLVTFSHRGRCRNDGAFAMLAGTAPLPASSGQTRRHRLNRGGDRDLNRAIHTITMSRWRTCPKTKAYIAKRRAEGLSDREIRRCLKRYITRELFRHLNAQPLDNT
jgi:transposase